MTPIYNAETLRKVSTDARLAEYNRIKENYVPAALLKINDSNFEAANNGYYTSTYRINMPCIGLDTNEAQNYFRIALIEALKELDLKPTFKNNNGIVTIICHW